MPHGRIQTRTIERLMTDFTRLDDDLPYGRERAPTTHHGTARGIDSEAPASDGRGTSGPSSRRRPGWSRR
jgi:hypothetical protein